MCLCGICVEVSVELVESGWVVGNKLADWVGTFVVGEMCGQAVGRVGWLVGGWMVVADRVMVLMVVAMVVVIVVIWRVVMCCCAGGVARHVLWCRVWCGVVWHVVRDV